MPRFEAILFDLGNTLVYFDGEWPQVFAQADAELLRLLQDAGLELDSDSFLTEFRARLNAYFIQRDAEFIEHTTAYVLRALLEELGHPAVSEAVLRPSLAAMYAVSQAHWLPEEDALPTLKTLRAQGYKLGLISNAGDDADVQTQVDHAGFRPHLDYVITSAAAGIRKPNPRLFQMALDQWAIPAKKAVMVGDTLGADILGAHNAGLFSVWITRRAGTSANRAHADTILPNATIQTLSQLPDLLLEL